MLLLHVSWLAPTGRIRIPNNTSAPSRSLLSTATEARAAQEARGRECCTRRDGERACRERGRCPQRRGPATSTSWSSAVVPYAPWAKPLVAIQVAVQCG